MTDPIHYWRHLYEMFCAGTTSVESRQLAAFNLVRECVPHFITRPGATFESVERGKLPTKIGSKIILRAASGAVCSCRLDTDRKWVAIPCGTVVEPSAEYDWMVME